ncbi:DUF4275 family protein [Paenibacillus sanguinis]|uniref:DUF4275 family protein n=1 Tax=Paenibacillus sanguinis TaxID=225906 RepID=UPI0003735AC4|nr:DUF4275 family protein [Paenibacillus sanguinis]
MIKKRIIELLDHLPEDELEDELKRIYLSLEFVQKNYLFRKNLREKGVVISEIYEGDQEIIELWENTFAQNISDEVKEAIYYSQYKWHIFSYEQQPCLKEAEAREAFDVEAKEELYVMYQNSPVLLQYSNANKVVAADFDEEQDIYLFDKHFNWTYVQTHESACGPYFYKLSNSK